MNRSSAGVAAVLAALVFGGCGASPAGRPGEAVCRETPVQHRWPEEYGRGRGQGDIAMIDGGTPHRAGEKRKVGWRVVGGIEKLEVHGTRTDGSGTVQFTVSGRVWPNGRDSYPQYSDFVSYLTLPSPGCWQLDLKAGEQQEQITLRVRG